MILKTKEAVTFNKGMAGTDSQVLIGGIIGYTRQGRDYFGANFVYALEDGTLINKGGFELRTESEILALNDLIKGNLPVYEDTPETEFEELKVFNAFRLEMFKLLTVMNPDLKIEDIEILPTQVEFK